MRSEFPNPPDHEFHDPPMLHRMSQVLKHRRSNVRDAARMEQPHKPSWVSDGDWERALRDVGQLDLFRQQQNVARARMEHGLGASHLGSGGRSYFDSYFVSF